MADKPQPRIRPAIVTPTSPNAPPRSDGKDQGQSPQTLWPRVILLGCIGLAATIAIFGWWIPYYTQHKAHQASGTEQTHVERSEPKAVWHNVYLDPNDVSDYIQVDPGTRQAMSPDPNASDAPYRVRCARKLMDGTFEHVECPPDGQVDYIYLENVTGEQQHVRWRPVAY